jgi:tight adherence protein C
VVGIIALLTFAAVALAAAYLLQPRENAVRRRMAEGATATEIAATRVLEGGPFERLIWPIFKSIGTMLARLLPANLVRNVEKTLVMANEPMTLTGFLAFWACIAAGAVMFVALLARSNPDLGLVRLLVLGGLIFSLGFMTPYGLMRRRARHRRRTIEKDLPDALDLLTTSVEAGLGVDAAFALVAERFRGPVAETFAEYLKRVGLGQGRKEALEDIAQRSGAADLIRLSGSVGQALDVGTSMGDVLRIQASEMRTVRRMRAQEAAQKAPVWMVIPLALCFIPAMVAVVIVPSILNLIRYVSGLG